MTQQTNMSITTTTQGTKVITLTVSENDLRDARIVINASMGTDYVDELINVHLLLTEDGSLELDVTETANEDVGFQNTYPEFSDTRHLTTFVGHVIS